MTSHAQGTPLRLASVSPRSAAPASPCLALPGSLSSLGRPGFGFDKYTGFNAFVPPKIRLGRTLLKSESRRREVGRWTHQLDRPPAPRRTQPSPARTGTVPARVIFPGHALHEKGLQRQKSAVPLVCSQEERALLVLSINLSNPKPVHTTGGSGRRARRSGRAGSSKIWCQQNYSLRKRKSTVPSKASKK